MKEDTAWIATIVSCGRLQGSIAVSWARETSSKGAYINRSLGTAKSEKVGEEASVPTFELFAVPRVPVIPESKL